MKLAPVGLVTETGGPPLRRGLTKSKAKARRAGRNQENSSQPSSDEKTTVTTISSTPMTKTMTMTMTMTMNMTRFGFGFGFGFDFGNLAPGTSSPLSSASVPFLPALNSICEIVGPLRCLSLEHRRHHLHERPNPVGNYFVRPGSHQLGQHWLLSNGKRRSIFREGKRESNWLE